jgi:hypothetical protein
MTIQGKGRRTDDTQRKIIDWLKQVHTGLAELYDGAVQLLNEEGFPGRGRFICHAVRDIRNELPDAVAGKATSPRLDYRREIDKLARAYGRAGLGSVREPTEQGQDGQWVGRDVLAPLQEIVQKHKGVRNTKVENAKRWLIALDPENKQLEQGLVPVVEKWIEETEWFVERAHEGKEIDEGELVQRFRAFEDVLQSLVGYFYEGLQELEELVAEANNTDEKPDARQVDTIVRRLGRPKYRIYFFDTLSNPYWIEPLKKAGFFQPPAEPKEGEAFERWPEGWYLKKMSPKAPEKVLWVIGSIESRNPYVRDACIECLLEMPENVASQGVSVIENTFPPGAEQGDLGWIGRGEKAAKLMVQLAGHHPKAAFKIAWILLDAWVPHERKGFRDIGTKFTDDDYAALVLKYFKELWEVDAWKALGVMVKILNRCLQELDKRDGYDVSSLFDAGGALQDLDSIDVGHSGIEVILVKGICEAGKFLAKHDPAKVSILLDKLENLERVIFLRIDMYLLRSVPPGTERDRINRLVGNQEFIENPLYEFEHRRLLNDKFDEVEDEVKRAFIEWIKKDKITEKWKREVVERCRNNKQELPDFEKWDYRIKGENLYLVRDRFKELYEECKAKAGLNDAALAPGGVVNKARWVSPMEGTPLEPEEMAKMSAPDVLEYVLNPKNYEGEKKPGQWGTPADALRATFKADVHKRSLEYLGCDPAKLQKLDPGFISALFYGIQDAVRGESFEKSTWPTLISFAHSIVRQNSGKANCRNCFLAILSTLRDGFTQENRKIQFDKPIIANLWEILESLVRYEENYEAPSPERDPMQMRCTSVNGEALEQVVMLGIACKQDLPSYFEERLKPAIEKLLDYVVTEVKRPEVNCTLGIDLGRIGWLDEGWLTENAERMLAGEMWDVVWGTHVSWGRPSRPGFNLLAERGIYKNAIEKLKLGKPNEYKFGKDPEEGFTEHLMIAFFNGWIDVGDELFNKFMDKASVKLRAHAAQFLTTGFKPEKDEGRIRGDVVQRLRAYWRKRLDAIEEEPSKNFEEAAELTGWAKDSLLEPRETLKLLEQTLHLSAGKLGKRRDTREFVEAVCDLGKGNELIALRCLKRAAADDKMRMPWARYQDRLVQFLESVADLPPDYKDIIEIQAEAIAVADAYGRLHPEKFHEIWKKLRKCAGTSESK